MQQSSANTVIPCRPQHGQYQIFSSSLVLMCEAVVLLQRKSDDFHIAKYYSNTRVYLFHGPGYLAHYWPNLLLQHSFRAEKFPPPPPPAWPADSVSVTSHARLYYYVGRLAGRGGESNCGPAAAFSFGSWVMNHFSVRSIDISNVPLRWYDLMK